MDPELAQRLIIALSTVGVLLLALEVFFTGTAMAPIGLLALCGAVGVGFYTFGIDTGALLLLGATTLVSFGLLGVLAFFPRSPLGKRWLTRTRRRIEREEATAQGATVGGDDAAQEATVSGDGAD